MKVKSKTHTSKQKKKARLSRASKPPGAISLEDAKILSQFAREIIKDLYPYALKNKSKAEITLVSNTDCTEELGAKIIVLDELKRRRLIKKYIPLKPKEVEFQPSNPRRPSKLEKEVNPDILYQQSPDDYMSFCSANALIEFYPKKIIKRYEKTERRKMVEDGFKTEQVLICNGLKFGLESGNVIYGDTVTDFMPDGQEYNLLKSLMEKHNKRLEYKKLCRIVFSNQRKWVSNQANSSIKHDIGFIIRNIKSKLEILKGKNKNLFSPCNGYRIVCNS